MGLILLEIATPATEQQFAAFIQALVADRQLLEKVDLAPHLNHFTAVFKGARFTAPIPPNIARFGNEIHHRPFAPCGAIAVLLNQCYPSRLEHVAQIWPQFESAIMSGRMPSAGLMRVVWDALWLGGSGRPDTPVASQCLIS